MHINRCPLLPFLRDWGGGKRGVGEGSRGEQRKRGRRRRREGKMKRKWGCNVAMTIIIYGKIKDAKLHSQHNPPYGLFGSIWLMEVQLGQLCAWACFWMHMKHGNMISYLKSISLSYCAWTLAVMYVIIKELVCITLARQTTCACISILTISTPYLNGGNL